MVYCVDCSNLIDKMPDWLTGVKVRFVCDNCRQKHPKPLLMDTDADTSVKAKGGDEEEAEVISLEEAALEEMEEPDFDDADSGFEE